MNMQRYECKTNKIHTKYFQLYLYGKKTQSQNKIYEKYSLLEINEIKMNPYI